MRFVSLSPNHIAPVDLANEKEPNFRISHFTDLSPLPLNKSFHFSTELQQFLHGKQLLLDEIPFPLTVIHDHYLNGFLTYHPGIVSRTCQRCGNHDERFFASFFCARCNENCSYCRKCTVMGRVSECTPLIKWSGPLSSNTEVKHALNWEGILSEAQQIASDEIIKTIDENNELLVWAVCGSGKTELLFPGIYKALQKGKRICITTPRTDVVHELTPRLKSAFSRTNIVSLYGGSEDRGKNAELVISTTHQLLRYSNFFDVTIIDEVDAFPFSTDQMLQFAVDSAKAKQSSTIYLTATPNQQWKKRVQQKRLQSVRIPARYHRNALPTPAFKWCGNWRKYLSKQHKLPNILKYWTLEKLKRKKQAFLFVPNIEVLTHVVELLRRFESSIDGVHAEDPNRKEKVDLFRSGDIPILVTTTILERGVTVPNVDVAVLGTDDVIFTESALVQIAGRVGRSESFPSGEILFFHYGKTKAMLAAQNHIVQMNREARKRGMLN